MNLMFEFIEHNDIQKVSSFSQKLECYFLKPV
jgi:hypothetical protein